MASIVHEALRRKLQGARVGRPPVADLLQLSELFARLLEDRLRQVFGVRPHIRVESASPQRRSSAWAHMAEGSLFAIAEIGGTFGGAVALSPGFASRMIEMLTGVVLVPPRTPPDQADSGEDVSEDDSERSFTAIDMALVRAPALAVFRALLDAMPMIPPPAMLNAFSAPVLRTGAEGGGPGEKDGDGVFITLTVELTGAADAFAMPVFIPLDTLDLLDGGTAGRGLPLPVGPPVWTDTMVEAARGAPLRMVGVLHEKKMSIGDIRELKVGSVIPMPHDHNMHINLRIDMPEGVAREPTIGGGKLGAVDGQRAVRLSGPPAADLLKHLGLLRQSG